MSDIKIHGRTRFIDKVSVYGLEFAVAMVTLIISVSVLSFAVFALCNFMAYDTVGTGRGYFALWSSASTLVWVPVALLFYLRVRAYMAQHPDVSSQPVQRVFTLIYDVVMILTIISFAVAAVYAALTSLVKPEDTGDILLGVALPSAISALLFGGALVSFFKHPVLRRRTFALVFALVTAAIVIPTIVVSVVTLRAANADQYKQSDLYQINAAIEDYAREKDMLPTRLSDINEMVNDEATASRLGEYTYKKVDSRRYELCTEFAERSRYVSDRAIQPYSTYANFSLHDAGTHCFKLRAPAFTDYRTID